MLRAEAGIGLVCACDYVISVKSPGSHQTSSPCEVSPSDELHQKGSSSDASGAFFTMSETKLGAVRPPGVGCFPRTL